MDDSVTVEDSSVQSQQDDISSRFMGGMYLDSRTIGLRQLSAAVESNLKRFISGLEPSTSSSVAAPISMESLQILIESLAYGVVECIAGRAQMSVDDDTEEVYACVMDAILSELVELPSEAGCWAYALQASAPLKLHVVDFPQIGFRAVPSVLWRWEAALHLLDVLLRIDSMDCTSPAASLSRVDLFVSMAEQLLRYEANRIPPGQPPLSAVVQMERDLLFLHVVWWWSWRVSTIERWMRQRSATPESHPGEKEEEGNGRKHGRIEHEAYGTVAELLDVGRTVATHTLGLVERGGVDEIRSHVHALLFPAKAWTASSLAPPMQRFRESVNWIVTLCVKFLNHPQLPEVCRRGMLSSNYNNNNNQDGKNSDNNSNNTLDLASEVLGDILRSALLPIAEELLERADEFLSSKNHNANHNLHGDGQQVSPHAVLHSVLDVVESYFGPDIAGQDDVVMTLRRL